MSNSTCRECAGPLPPKGATGPRPAYCSKRCQNAASYRRRKAAGTVWRPPRVEPESVKCAECARSFESPRSDARFCSRKCQSAWGRKNETGECSAHDCARPVRAKGLCNMHYKAVLRSEGRIPTKTAWDDARRDAYHRRRALKKGASTGRPVVMADIAERDHWVCQLCGLTVNPELAWPDPMSKSLDHIEPLSLGGLHDPDNVQLAHLRCNSSKGNRVA